MSTNIAATIAEARKALITLAGVIAQVIALGFLTGNPLHWATVVLAALTAITVYAVPNRVSGKDQAAIINNTPGAK